MAESSPDEAWSIDDRFSFLIEPRQGKPRETGITFIQGAGPFYAVLGADHLRSLLSYAGAWFDWYKFTIAANAFQPPGMIEEKLRLLDAYDVQAFPGGNFLEEAMLDGAEEAYLEAVREVGFPRVEVSITAIDATTAEQAAVIERAAEMGFDVIGEVGRKSPGDEVPVGALIDDMRACLDAGADTVVLESDEFEAAFGEGGGDDAAAEAALDDILDAVGPEKIVFEVPQTQERVVLEACAWLIRTVGKDVNIGNVNPNYINWLEQMRRGLTPRVPR